MELVRNDVHSRLQQLAKKDRKRKVFGTSRHDYQLNPPLDAEEVESSGRTWKATWVRVEGLPCRPSWPVSFAGHDRKPGDVTDWYLAWLSNSKSVT